MAKKLKVIYPWQDTPPGGRFFVPTLDPVVTIREGLQAAIGVHVVPDKPRIGMCKGCYGVMFWRRLTEPSPPSPSD